MELYQALIVLPPLSKRDGHTKQIIAVSCLLHEVLSFLSFGFWSASWEFTGCSQDPSEGFFVCRAAELLSEWLETEVTWYVSVL